MQFEPFLCSLLEIERRKIYSTMKTATEAVLKINPCLLLRLRIQLYPSTLSLMHTTWVRVEAFATISGQFNTTPHCSK